MTELAHYYDGRAHLESDRRAASWTGGFYTHRPLTSRAAGNVEGFDSSEA